jgi:hypothetical protein
MTEPTGPKPMKSTGCSRYASSRRNDTTTAPCVVLSSMGRRSRTGAMKLEHALLGRHPEPQREAVVACSAMDVEPILAPPLETVIGDAGEGRDDRVRQPHPQESELAPVSMAGQHEVRRPVRQVAEGSRIVEQPDAHHVALAGVARAHLLEMRLPIAESKVESKDLDRTRPSLDAAHRIDQECDPRGSQSRAPMSGRFEVVVADAREAAALEIS